MGLSHSPSLVMNGLTLCLDAANTKSILSAVEVLVVAGGGGGGMDMGGGGGGGGVIYSSAVSITPGSAITATVGNGGVGAPAGSTNGQPGAHQFTISATQGGNSVFGALTAIGGGFGASSYYGYTPNSGYGGTGGSGGGNSGYSDGNIRPPVAGTPGQGNNGGQGGGQYYSGGGGGAGAPGVDSTNQPNGGVGVENSILGVSYFWGGGGGGASYSLSTGGNGGNGGGGGGAVGTTVGGSGLNPGSPGGGGSPNSQTNTPGGNAGANTGGGGGGGSHYNSNNKGGDGGSGIVIVRYPGSQRATGGTITSVAGHTIHTFTTSGTFTPNFGDLSNNGNTGTLTNGPTYSSANGGSLVFDGSNDFMQANVNTTALDGDPTFSVDMFIRRRTGTNIGPNQAPWGIGGEGQGNGVGGWTPTTNLINLDFYDSTRLASTEYYPEGQFVHIAWTKNGAGAETSNVKCYVNGIERALTKTRDATRTNQFNTSTNGVGIVLGRLNGNSGNFHAPVDVASFKVYTRALSAAEVSQNYNALRGRYGL